VIYNPTAYHIEVPFLTSLSAKPYKAKADAARIHSWNPKVQARVSAHHYGQFQLGCVCFVRTVRTSVIISALHKLRNTRNAASAETRAAAVVRT
jgi:hypothetical protein